MHHILRQFEKTETERLSASKKTPDFAPGDTVKVNVKVVEGNRERVQAYEGVVISIKNSGMNSAFTVRKISYGEGVERVFPMHSPRIDSVELVRKGRVRRAKLYYLRDRRGKSARIAEKVTQSPKQAAAAAAASEAKSAAKEKTAKKTA